MHSANNTFSPGVAGWLGRVHIIVLLIVASCGSPEPSAEKGPLSHPELHSDDTVLAIINGSSIYLEDLERAALAKERGEQTVEPTMSTEVFSQTLDELIDQRLLAQEALKTNLHTDHEARRRIDAARERILGNILVERYLDDRVSDAAINRLYKEQSKLLNRGEEIRVSHILRPSREDIEYIIDQLNSGKPFTELALDHSIDESSRFDGGDLGYLTADTLPDPFAEALVGLEISQLSRPFETEAGWHLARIVDRRTTPTPSLDALRPDIINFLTFDEIQKLLQKLRTQAEIEVLVDGPPEQKPTDPKLR